MKKEKTSYQGLQTWLIIALTILISSCNGQESKNDANRKIAQVQTGKYNSSLKNENAKDQISEVVRMMFQDSKGVIWFGTQGGAYRLLNDSLYHIEKIKSESGGNVTIKDISEDNEGRIWIGHTDGLSLVDGDLVTNYYETDGLISHDVWCIETDLNGNVWIGTIEGVCIFNGKQFKNFELPEGKIDTTLGISSKKMIHNITEDSAGTIWLSTNAGLFSYANNKLTNISEKFGIQTSFINEIYEDRSGAIWISTKQGLYKLDENNAINITEGKIEIGKGIGSIVEDKSGKIWFVSNQHYLYSYDGNAIIEFQKSDDNKGPVVFQIYKDQNDRLWFVGYGGAYRFEDEKFVNITKEGPW